MLRLSAVNAVPVYQYWAGLRYSNCASQVPGQLSGTGVLVGSPGTGVFVGGTPPAQSTPKSFTKPATGTPEAEIWTSDCILPQAFHSFKDRAVIHTISFAVADLFSLSIIKLSSVRVS